MREVFVRRHVEGASVKETARALHLSEAAVKTRLHRACRILRKETCREAVEAGICPRRRAGPP
ncbi:MAG: sigma factor-like helix-turn-helix DNA-binding protein [Polyangia bacterium]